MARIIWKTAQVKTAIEDIARDIGEAFAIAAPPVMQPEGRTGRDWEWQIETVEIWTKAGRAELNVRIDASFAHLYFRFDDPARAADLVGKFARLNQFSGKWNWIETPGGWARNGKPDPQDSLDMFRAQLRADFRKVAEPNPPADEVAVYRAKDAERAAQWEQYRKESEQ